MRRQFVGAQEDPAAWVETLSGTFSDIIKDVIRVLPAVYQRRFAILCANRALAQIERKQDQDLCKKLIQSAESYSAHPQMAPPAEYHRTKALYEAGREYIQEKLPVTMLFEDRFRLQSCVYAAHPINVFSADLAAQYEALAAASPPLSTPLKTRKGQLEELKGLLREAYAEAEHEIYELGWSPMQGTWLEVVRATLARDDTRQVLSLFASHPETPRNIVPKLNVALAQLAEHDQALPYLVAMNAHWSTPILDPHDLYLEAVNRRSDPRGLLTTFRELPLPEGVGHQVGAVAHQVGNRESGAASELQDPNISAEDVLRLLSAKHDWYDDQYAHLVAMFRTNPSFDMLTLHHPGLVRVVRYFSAAKEDKQILLDSAEGHLEGAQEMCKGTRGGRLDLDHDQWTQDMAGILAALLEFQRRFGEDPKHTKMARRIRVWIKKHLRLPTDTSLDDIVNAYPTYHLETMLIRARRDFADDPTFDPGDLISGKKRRPARKTR